MSLHYSSRRLSLKNTTNNQWYFISASVLADGHTYLKISQDSQGSLPLVDYDTYAVIRVDNGDLYKLSLETNGSGVIDYRFEPAILPVTQQPVRIFVKDEDTGLLYEVLGKTSEIDGLVYVNVSLISSANNTSIDRPFRCQVPVTTTANTCRHPASFFSQATVIIPPFTGVTHPYPPVDESILGEGGEAIIGEGGEDISPEN